MLGVLCTYHFPESCALTHQPLYGNSCRPTCALHGTGPKNVHQTQCSRWRESAWA